MKRSNVHGIKICGVTTPAILHGCLQFPAIRWIGFNAVPKSPRFITAEGLAQLLTAASRAQAQADAASHAQADAASHAQADAATTEDTAGTNRHDHRYTAPDTTRSTQSTTLARWARGQASAAASRVGVFVDPDHATIDAYTPSLDVIQLHGNESPEAVTRLAEQAQKPIWKALSIRSPADVSAIAQWRGVPLAAFVLDAPKCVTYDGGATFDWNFLTPLASAYANNEQAEAGKLLPPFLLAGGIHVGNVCRARSALASLRSHSWGIDVASGVESARGVKSLSMIAALMQAFDTCADASG
ncbi:MAG: phosphoribosylanthranilate isomerase [Alphaproteobacteria bacterium]|nr:phosphoribosylanthranilate isomerase [Alphaproteobacteria bacterium]